MPASTGAPNPSPDIDAEARAAATRLVESWGGHNHRDTFDTMVAACSADVETLALRTGLSVNAVEKVLAELDAWEVS